MSHPAHNFGELRSNIATFCALLFTLLGEGCDLYWYASDPSNFEPLVKVTMIEYVDEIIELWDKACSELDDEYKVVSGRKRIATAAPDDLFKVDEDDVKLEQTGAKSFHNITAKAIYVTKRARLDISLAIAFLTTRVKGPTIDDWRKLCHLIEYL
jgi:hypothetical protein